MPETEAERAGGISYEGRVAFDAWYSQPTRRELDHASWWQLKDIQREEWAAVERAVRADERREIARRTGSGGEVAG